MDSQVNQNETLFVSSGLSHKPSLPSVPADSMFTNASAASAVLVVMKLSSNASFIKISRVHSFLYTLVHKTILGGKPLALERLQLWYLLLEEWVCVSLDFKMWSQLLFHVHLGGFLKWYSYANRIMSGCMLD